MFQKYTGPFIILCIALIGLSSAANTDWKFAANAKFEDGATQANMEDEFNEALTIRPASIYGWNALRFAAFGEISDGAVLGADTWLFTDEEYLVSTDFDARMSTSLQRIISARDRLKDSQVELIVALLPDKARIAAKQVAVPRAPKIKTRYNRMLNDLRAQDFVVPDLSEALAVANDHAPVFMRTDTHWSPHGARAAARVLAPEVQSRISERTSFESQQGETAWHHGDLYNFLDTGPFASLLGHNDEPLETWSTYAVPDADTNSLSSGLFGDSPAIEVALVGTSYSAIPTWNFLGFLMDEADTDILNFSDEGRGPFAPMDDFLATLHDLETPPKLVIWEIPERYLVIDAKNP